MYDLHLHSIYSDGNLTPNEICKIAKDRGLSGIALTDHDNIDGLDEMKNACTSYNLDFIPGIEFGVTHKNKEIHILGYFIDYKDSYITTILDEMKANRVIRIKKMIDQLIIHGIDISYKDVLRFSKKDVISRTHIAQALVKQKFCKDIPQAFNKFLSYGKPGYVEKKEIGINRIINIIKKIGGIPILAHPSTIDDDDIVSEIIDSGICGLEIINSKHTYTDIVRYNTMCDNNNLVKTVGSDCHGRNIYDDDLLIGNYCLNRTGLQKLVELKGKIDNGK